ncbi:hypothetical protein L210DRAFT_3717325 [Boletus edulis BED1]|uniref:Uncharacterized protein n=1 Tax=Boletus edulis BED1 TaxID=1328754 RepID=A0AAD4GA54_BOLED|nr:hypothetical protein L210DRAFT_3717325 [Boletus edulis BED1]
MITPKKEEAESRASVGSGGITFGPGACTLRCTFGELVCTSTDGRRGNCRTFVTARVVGYHSHGGQTIFWGSGDCGPFGAIDEVAVPVRYERKAQVPQGPQASLGYDILDARYNSLKYKRRYLSIIYYQIARLGYFSPNEVQKSIDWLAANPNDTTTSYILAATLAAFDPAEPHPFTGNVRKNLTTDKGTIVHPWHRQAPPPPRSPQPRSRNQVEAFVRQELVPASKPDASLASRIFNEIESIGTTVTQAQIARQNAQSNTIPPSGPGSQPSLGYDILDARYDSLKYERRYLSIVYYQTARLGYFSPNEILPNNPYNADTTVLLVTDP